jgi:hypothetical protein
MWFFSNLYYFIHFAFALIFSSLNLYQADVAFKKNAINILCHGLGHGGMIPKVMGIVLQLLRFIFKQMELHKKTPLVKMLYPKDDGSFKMPD